MKHDETGGLDSESSSDESEMAASKQSKEEAMHVRAGRPMPAILYGSASL